MHDVDRLRHDHDDATASRSQGERRTLSVILPAGGTVVLEIVDGTVTGSMAHAKVEVIRLREESCPTLLAAESGL